MSLTKRTLIDDEFVSLGIEDIEYIHEDEAYIIDSDLDNPLLDYDIINLGGVGGAIDYD